MERKNGSRIKGCQVKLQQHPYDPLLKTKVIKGSLIQSYTSTEWELWLRSRFYMPSAAGPMKEAKVALPTTEVVSAVPWRGPGQHVSMATTPFLWKAKNNSSQGNQETGQRLQLSPHENTTGQSSLHNTSTKIHIAMSKNKEFLRENFILLFQQGIPSSFAFLP